MVKNNFNLKIENSICVKCGACIVSHPEAFKFDGDGNIEVLKSAEGSELSKIKESCPVGAILDND